MQLAEVIEEKKINIYDLGDISRYLLSIFTPKNDHATENGDKTPFYGFSEIYKFIFENVPNSKIFAIGGTDELTSTIYKTEGLFQNVIHLDSGIDVKQQFMQQLRDVDKDGALIFPPTFHEHHKSYLRDIFDLEVNKDPLNIKSLIFYGIQGLNVSEEDVSIIKQRE